MEQLYKNIKTRRLELGLTQGELAAKLGYADKSAIAKIEAGLTDLSRSKILAFAEVLRVSPSWLIGWGENDERAALVQRLYDDNRILFDAAEEATPEEIQKAAEYLAFLKSQR